MTISYPLTLVNNADIARMRLGMRNVVGMNESPFTLQQQAYQHQGQAWVAELELNPLPRAQAEEWVAFCASLMGRYGTFLMGDPTGQIPRGSAGGSPKVRVASQTGNTLQIYAATGSATNWLLRGDYIQLGAGSTARLHKVLTDTNTTSGGVATLDIWPRLRTSPASGATVAVNSCVGVFRLREDEPFHTVEGPTLFHMTINAMEAL